MGKKISVPKFVRTPLNRVINKVILSKWLKRLLKGLCHPTRMREPMKPNLKKSGRLFQVVSEILEG